jgi:hypothetical protein
MKYTAVKLKYYDYILIAVLYGLLLFPYMCSVLNTIPTADDFSFANEMRQWMGITDNYVAALIRFAASQWLNWGVMVCHDVSMWI